MLWWLLLEWVGLGVWIGRTIYTPWGQLQMDQPNVDVVSVAVGADRVSCNAWLSCRRHVIRRAREPPDARRDLVTRQPLPVIAGTPYTCEKNSWVSVSKRRRKGLSMVNEEVYTTVAYPKMTT